MLHLVVNPAAGGGRALASLPRLQAALRARGLEHATWVTGRPGEAREFAARAPGLEPVVAVGGDGTVGEVLAGVLGTGRPLGVVPLGSGNDFARGLGLRGGDLGAAVAVLAAGRLEPLDGGLANGRPFGCGLGTGFDAAVAVAAERAPRGLRGLARYAWGIAAALPRLQATPVRVVADGEAVYEGPGLLVAAMTMPSYGGGFRIAPDAKPGDGLLDLVVGGRFSRAAAVAVLPRVVAGRHLGHREVRVFRVREARVQWAEPTPAHLDGERLEASEVFTVRACPGALRVFVPASFPGRGALDFPS